MIKAFLDANILFAAAYSSTGGSFYIFELAKKDKIKVFTSRLAVKEAEKNLRDKASEEALDRFYNFMSEIDIKFVEANRDLAKSEFSRITGEKDAPIFAAALKSGAVFLITLDKKHLLNIRFSKIGKLQIVSPGDFIEKHL